MRPYGLVLTAGLLAAIPAGAQTPPASTTPPAVKPPAAPAVTPLDRYLLRWEEEMRKVQTMAAQLNRTDKDKSFDSVKKYVGFAQYMKVGTGPSAVNKALLELKQEGKTEIADKFVCTGTFLYRFVPATKSLEVYELPKPKPGQVADENFITLLLGMKADEAKRRYILSLAKEDKWYVYVDVAPRFPADKADFKRARLVLNKDSFLPRQLWFEHPNGNEVTWDIPRMQTGVVLAAKNFDAPATPTGWKMIKVERAAPAPPRVPK
jgi:TIGR03009 family protein